MKCPELYKIHQMNVSRQLYNELDIYQGNININTETQHFLECYGEQCMAYDKEKKLCKKYINVP